MKIMMMIEDDHDYVHVLPFPLHKKILGLAIFLLKIIFPYPLGLDGYTMDYFFRYNVLV